MAEFYTLSNFRDKYTDVYVEYWCAYRSHVKPIWHFHKLP